jgi:hypothetical protein
VLSWPLNAYQAVLHCALSWWQTVSACSGRLQGGYFVVNGSEKVLIAQERMANNHVYVFRKARACLPHLRSQHPPPAAAMDIACHAFAHLQWCWLCMLLSSQCILRLRAAAALL